MGTQPTFGVLALLLLAQLAPAQSAADISTPAVTELLSNPLFANGANGWTLRLAQPAANGGPDGLPAVELQGSSGEEAWPAAYTALAVDVAGESLELSVRVRGSWLVQRVWLSMAAWEWKDGEWSEIDSVRDSFVIRLTAWRTCTLKFRVPEGAQSVVASFQHNTSEPMRLAQAHLASLDDPGHAAAHEVGSLTVSEVAASMYGWQVAAEQLRGRSLEHPPNLQIVSRDRYSSSKGPYAADHPLELITRALRRLQILRANEHVGSTLEALIARGANGQFRTHSNTVLLTADMHRELAPAVVVHELCHALDEQQFNSWAAIEAIDPYNLDAYLAGVTLVEAPATAFMNDFAMEEAAAGRGPPDLVTRLAMSGVSGSVAEADISPYFTIRLRAPYVLGPRFLRGAHSRGLSIGEAADTAFDEPPVSTEQILHPATYWDDHEGPREIDLGNLSPQLGAGWSLLATGTLGELYLGALVGATVPDAAAPGETDLEAWTHPATVGWGGDCWQLYAAGESELLILVTLWDTEQDAKEFHGAVELPERSIVSREGDRVICVLGDVGAPLGDAASATARSLDD